jgi:hypothetical protein
MTDFVRSITIDSCQSTSYDLAIFASGYEERATYLARQLDSSAIERSLVLGFTSIPDAPVRKGNDEYFSMKWSEPIPCAPDDDRPIYRALSSLQPKRALSVLVDYSSMSRDWYAAVLNWLATSEYRHTIQVDFGYSIGTTIAPFEPLPILDVTTVPGFEGISLKNRVVLFLGLGFDPLAPMAVLERMEPSRVLAFLAAPGAAEWYVQECLRVNASILEEYVEDRAILRLPLNDIPRSVSLLAEAAAPLLTHSRVVFVPMGPKPHVLATFLTCLRLPEASVLHVRSQRNRPDLLSPTGDFVLSRVEWPLELDLTVQLAHG